MPGARGGLFRKQQNSRGNVRKERLGLSRGGLSAMCKRLEKFYFLQGKPLQCPKVHEGDKSKTKKKLDTTAKSENETN